MFAYCGNNPVNYSDPTGLILKELWPEFQETVKETANYFAVAAGVSQIDSPAPGPADILCLSMLLAGLVYCGGKALYDVLSTSMTIDSTPYYTDSSSDDLSRIASSYGNFRCKEAADHMVEYLKKNGRKAEIICIVFIGGRGYIWSDIAGKTISENGIHVGVLYNGVVYCNVHPLGLPLDSWIEDFHGTGTKTISTISI